MYAYAADLSLTRHRSPDTSSTAEPSLAVITIIYVTGGKSFDLIVTPSTSIDSVKTRIMYKEGVPPHQQRLLFAGRRMEDGRFLADVSYTDRILKCSKA